MENLEIYKPCTVFIRFVNPPAYFELFDVNEGKAYYFRFLDGKTPRIKFNIVHPGEYSANVPYEITKITDIRTPFNLPELPTPDRNRFQEATIEHNPAMDDMNIASIYSKEGRIEVSDRFLSLPKQIQGFLLYHERGHMLYSKEEDCDWYAFISCMLKGYNRSMCFYAMSEYLSDTPENEQRINKMFSLIQRTQSQRA